MFVYSRFIINTFAYFTGMLIIINLVQHTKELWLHRIVSSVLKPKMQARVESLFELVKMSYECV